MSANRKLQAEIDKVLKNVEEGTEIFDDIWGKVYNAGQQKLKEKYEGDLKKEIKKLQRLRDQLKSWIASGDVKDKAPLVDARKLIESKMEQFKICEKDTKTKAYSKEGLLRDSRMDPKEQEREEKRTWLNESIEKLQEIIDQVELEVEKLSSGREAKKSKNKEQSEKLDNRIKKNKWHIGRLELILRLLDAEELEPETLDSIKDGVDYYIESAVDDDGALGIEEEFDIYEDLQLDATTPQEGGSTSLKEDEDVDGAAASGSVNGGGPIATSSAGEATDDNFVETDEGESDGAQVSTQSTQSAKKVVPAITANNPTASLFSGGKIAPSVKPPVTQSSVASAVAALGVKTTVAKPATTVPTAPSAMPIPGNAQPLKQQPGATLQQPPVVPKPMSAQPGASIGPPLPSSASIAASQIQPVKKVTASGSPVVPNKEDVSWAVKSQQLEVQQAGLGIMYPQQQQSGTPFTGLPSQQSSITLQGFPATTRPGALQASPQTTLQPGGVYSLPTAPGSMNGQFRSPPAPSPSGTIASGTASAIPTQSIDQQVLASLKASMQYAPQMAESERQQSFVPRNTYIGHPSYPQQTVSVVENPLLFERLPTDSLFLAFYHQQGSYQQYLAAKQLKKQSWRYHKKFMTWFQRHDEPKKTTDEYEEGTYVYFDYESGWCPRLKSEFKFEYSFLEDDFQ